MSACAKRGSCSEGPPLPSPPMGESDSERRAQRDETFLIPLPRLGGEGRVRGKLVLAQGPGKTYGILVNAQGIP
jgi:hypothetical protein